jgi:SPP1 family predicted phage head-tail adaptor
VSAAGRLRERVVIEAPIRAGDGAGGTMVTWTPLATMWAEMRMLTGAEVTLGERDEARSPVIATIRFRDDVTAEMRLVWRGRALNIRALRDPDGARRWLELRAEGGGA